MATGPFSKEELSDGVLEGGRSIPELCFFGNLDDGCPLAPVPTPLPDPRERERARAVTSSGIEKQQLFVVVYFEGVFDIYIFSVGVNERGDGRKSPKTFFFIIFYQKDVSYFFASVCVAAVMLLLL